MKKFKTISLQEGNWVEHLPIDTSNLTNEERLLILSMSEENKEAKSALLKSLRQTQPLDEMCEGIMTEKYNTALGNDKDHEDFQLINVSASLCQGEGKCRGVINYVIGKEHKQVRF